VCKLCKGSGKHLTQHPGILSACVNLVTEVAVVECEASKVDPVDLATRLTVAGFATQPRYAQGELGKKHSYSTTPDTESQWRRMQSSWQLVTAGVLLFLSSLGHLSQLGSPVLPLDNIWFHCGLATVALVGPGSSIIVNGWRGLRRNAPNMNSLVGLGTLTAYTASLVALLFPQLGWECFFDEPVMLLGFILLGRTLEQQARGRAAAAFKQLLALQPQVAHLIADPKKAAVASESVEIPADCVRVGNGCRFYRRENSRRW
jgi:Cu2+-exporting ATPase